MTRPKPLDVIVTFVPMIAALLSIVGATTIMYNILSDNQRRFTSPYFRIMFGLSLSDLLFGLISSTTSFLDPKDSPGHFFYARGNEASCKAIGFLRHFFALIQPIYVAFLSFYYLLVIKYDTKDEVFRKKVEPWAHAVSYGYPLLGSVVCQSLGMFNVTPLGCIITAYPFNCREKDKKTCIRGANAYIFRWIYSYVIIILSFTVIVICMLSILLHVRRRERIMNRRFSFNNSEISRSRSLVKQYKTVTRQACLYIGCFFLVWAFPAIFIGSERLYFLKILGYVFLPLQGFLNAIVYFWPRYVKTREEHQDKSVCWVLKDMIFTTTRAKEQRRVVRHAVRRRSTLMNVASRQHSSTISQSTSPTQTHVTIDTIQESAPLSHPANSSISVTLAATDSVALDSSESQGPSSPSQISTIYYEPLVRFRATKVHFDKSVEDEEEDMGTTKDSTVAAALAGQAMYGQDDDSTI